MKFKFYDVNLTSTSTMVDYEPGDSVDNLIPVSLCLVAADNSGLFAPMDVNGCYIQTYANGFEVRVVSDYARRKAKYLFAIHT